MKQLSLLLVLLTLLLVSCSTEPSYTKSIPVQPSAAAGGAGFDPALITEEVQEATIEELRAFAENLNAIIRARDYEAWIGYLSDSFYAKINSDDFLAKRTYELFRRDQMVAAYAGRDPRRVQKRVLHNSRDFFYNVVVPARSNYRLDDIAFVSENRVKAFTLDNRGNRLVLYDLERIGGRWQIIN